MITACFKELKCDMTKKKNLQNILKQDKIILKQHQLRSSRVNIKNVANISRLKSKYDPALKYHVMHLDGTCNVYLWNKDKKLEFMLRCHETVKSRFLRARSPSSSVSPVRVREPSPSPERPVPLAETVAEPDKKKKKEREKEKPKANRQERDVREESKSEAQVKRQKKRDNPDPDRFKIPKVGRIIPEDKYSMKSILEEGFKKADYNRQARPGKYQDWRKEQRIKESRKYLKSTIDVKKVRKMF